MNFKNITIACILLILSFSAKAAEDPFRIEIEAPQLKNRSLVLCNYFNGRNYTQDSIKLSDEGKGAFTKPQLLHEGLYLIYVDSLKYFDFLLSDDQIFKITIDTTDFLRNNVIEGAVQSEAFQEYAKFISSKQRERHHLVEEMKTLQAEEPKKKKDIEKKDRQIEEIKGKIETLNDEVLAYQASFKEKHQGQWVEMFFKGLDPIESGPHPVPQNREEAIAEFEYQKYHYFDNIDVADSRFWYTNYYPQKVDMYFKQQVENIPDSLAKAASWLVGKTVNDSISFRMTLSKLTNFAVRSEIMGMENVWAKLAEDYYLKGLATWADSAFMANIESEYRKIRYNRIGMKAPNLMLQDSTGKAVQLYDLAKKATLLYFFEPSCGHCKKTTPRIHDELYKKYHDQGFEVACIYTMTDKNEWMKFIEDHQLKDWNNLWDPERTSYYWQFYDTSVTPGIYLLDEKKDIVAKKLDVESLDRLIGYLLRVEN